MKIFFIGAFGDSTGQAPPDSMEAHVIDAFSDMGHECVYFPYLTAWPGQRLNRVLELACTDFRLLSETPVDKKLFSLVGSVAPDVVMTLLGNYTAPRVIEKVKKITGVPVVCWCQDHMGTMGRQYLVGSHYDHIFCKDLILVDRLKRFCATGKAHFLPEACNPEVHRPLDLSESDQARYECDILSVATLYYYRSAILEGLMHKDLRIYGALPRFYDGPLKRFHQGRGLYCDDKARAFRAARIVLNTLFPAEMGGVNARTFEAAGCGAFQLMTDSPEIERYFVPGKEIVTFADHDDLRDKVDYYLAHKGERQEIARAGCDRAHRDHSYQIRLTEMLSRIFTV